MHTRLKTFLLICGLSVLCENLNAETYNVLLDTSAMPIIR